MKKNLLVATFLLFCIHSYAQLFTNVYTQNVSCSGGANGTATVIVTGGTPGYSFIWNPSVSTSSVATGLAAGQYTVWISDAASATRSINIYIAQPNVLTASITQMTASCYGPCTGSFIISATGGAPPYMFLTSFLSTTAYNQNVCVGAHTYTVTDGNNCSFSNTLTMTQPPSPLNVVSSSTNVTCGSSCNGAASAAVSGGLPPYSYTWSPGGITTPTVSGLCVGPTTLQVRDFNGCSYTQMGNISQISPAILNVNVTSPTCVMPTCNGSASVTVSTATGPFTYNWNFSSGQTFTTQTIQNVCGGNYTLNVTDGNGCVKTATGTIVSPVNSIPNVTVTAAIYNETCINSGDAAIDLTVTGSNPGPFTYQWATGATTQDITNLVSYTYSVIITDANQACEWHSYSVGAIGTNCGTISGNVFIDANSDCIKNNGDFNFQNAMIVVNPGNRLGYSDLSGNYTINNLPYTTYSVSVGGYKLWNLYYHDFCKWRKSTFLQ